jgi:hypothetical protein
MVFRGYGLGRLNNAPPPTRGLRASAQAVEKDKMRREPCSAHVSVEEAKLMISRRDFLGTTAGLTSASWLLAQDAQRPVFWVKLSVTVAELVVWHDVLAYSHTRYINGLLPSDFRVLEDGIPQKITTFAEGSKPPLLVSNDGSTRPMVDPKAGEVGKSGLDLRSPNPSVEDLDNSYTITYYPDPSNHNDGFRKIHIEIVPDLATNWRVRSSAGYRPRSDSRVVSI